MAAHSLGGELTKVCILLSLSKFGQQ